MISVSKVSPSFMYNTMNFDQATINYQYLYYIYHTYSKSAAVLLLNVVLNVALIQGSCSLRKGFE